MARALKQVFQQARAAARLAAIAAQQGVAQHRQCAAVARLQEEGAHDSGGWGARPAKVPVPSRLAGLLRDWLSLCQLSFCQGVWLQARPDFAGWHPGSWVRALACGSRFARRAMSQRGSLSKQAAASAAAFG